MLVAQGFHLNIQFSSPLEERLDTNGESHSNDASPQCSTTSTTCTSAQQQQQQQQQQNGCPPQQRKRRESLYKLKNIEAPSVTRGNSISKRTEFLFQNYERDISVHEAKPMINVNEDISIDEISPGIVENGGSSKTKIDLAREEKERELLEIKQQYQQRLLDEEEEQRRQRKMKRTSSKSFSFDFHLKDYFISISFII